MHLALGGRFPPYAGRMEGEPHILMKIDTAQPIELGDFVSLFVAVGNQFEKFIAQHHPEQKGEARFYVKEVRAGCIEAELIGWFVGGTALLGGVMTVVEKANELADFVGNYGGRLRKYFAKGGRDEDAGKSDLTDFNKTVAAIARDPDASLSLKAAYFEDGERQVRAAFEFETPQAREAELQIADHRKELEATSDADRQRVLMVFTRTNVAHATTGKRSGELVEIEAIHPRALPIVYASTLAEERIRHEIAEADENVYKKGFDVDVNVEMRGGKPIAYRIVAVHDVIDLPD
jgi:hypothetical protein